VIGASEAALDFADPLLARSLELDREELMDWTGTACAYWFTEDPTVVGEPAFSTRPCTVVAPAPGIRAVPEDDVDVPAEFVLRLAVTSAECLAGSSSNILKLSPVVPEAVFLGD
jgi:hypothetical protein